MTILTDFAALPDAATIDETAAALRERNHRVIVADTREAALSTLIDLLPEGVTLFANQSVSLREIGFVDYLAEHPERYENLRTPMLAEADPAVRMQMRRRSSVVEWMVGSANALTQAGELVFASHGGSQLAGYAFTAEHVVWVVGAQKIVSTLDDAFRRVREYASPLEDRRLGRTEPEQALRIGKILSIEYEWFNDRSTVILVKDALGF